MTAEDRGWGSGWPDCQWGDLVDIAAGRGDVAFPGGVHEDVAVIFTAFLDEFDAQVEKLQDGWCWGAACRPIRGTRRPSNHSWWLAVDVNAPNHPLGKAGTFTRRQADTIRTLAGRYGLRWGGDYDGRVDEMHFEYMGTPADARRLAAGLDDDVRRPDRKPVAPGSDVDYEDPVDAEPGDRILTLGSAGTDVGFVQRWLGETDDGYYGPQTEGAVEDYQAMQGLAVDGVVGPNTWEAMGQAGTYTVRDGDTLSAIADRFGTDWRTLAETNGIDDPDVIQPGRDLKIPDTGGGRPEVPGWPLPDGHWFGPESSDDRNHSGYWQTDRRPIRRWQKKMRQRGWTIDVDGRYGRRDETVATKFQREKGLAVDGLVGPETWTATWAAPIT